MKPVNKYTRARKHIGREIACPLCNYWETVYHFAWSAITCYGCKADVEKEKWLVVDDIGLNRINDSILKEIKEKNENPETR